MPRDETSIFYVGSPISYREAMKSFNNSVFENRFYGVPKKGTASYNAIQKIRAGKPPPTFKTIDDLTKPEETILIKKSKVEKPKKEKKVEPKVEVKSFGSTVKEQTENILKTLSSRNENIERQKKAVRKALEILKYKENHIIQEARKPLQRELFSLLQSIKTKPKFTQFYLPSPTGGNTGRKDVDLTEVAEEIPVFEKSVVDVVEKEIKAEKRQMNNKKREEDQAKLIEQQEQKKKEEEERSKVNVEALKSKWGKGINNKYPSDELFQKMADYGITDSLNYERNKKDLPHYKEFIFAFGNTFFSKFEEFLEERYVKPNK